MIDVYLISVVLISICFGAAVVAVVLKSILNPLVHKVNTSVSAMEEKVNSAVNKANVVISNVNGVVGNASDKVEEVLSYWAILQISLASFAICRNIYTRFYRQDKESVTERTILKAFDVLAFAAICPMFIKDGPAASFKLWRTLKSILTMLRDAVGSYSFISSFFGSSTHIRRQVGDNIVLEPNPNFIPFVGSEVIADIDNVAEELQERIEDHPEGKDNEEFIDSPGSSSSECGSTCDSCGAKGVSAIHVKFCKKLHDQPVTDYHAGLRKMWTKVEDQRQVKRVLDIARQYPAAAPFVFILFFCILLCFIRWLYKRKPQCVSDPVNLLSEVAVESVGKDSLCLKSEIITDVLVKVVQPKIESSSSLLEPFHPTPLPSSNAVIRPVEECKSDSGMPVPVGCVYTGFKLVEKRKKNSSGSNVSNGGRKRKPWIDYDRCDGDGNVDPNGMFYRDDIGEIYAYVGRRAGRAAAKRGQDLVGSLNVRNLDENQNVPQYMKGRFQVEYNDEVAKTNNLSIDHPIYSMTFIKTTTKELPKECTIVEMPKGVKFVTLFKNNNSVEKRSKSDFAKYVKTLKCNNCGVLGHLARDCDSPKERILTPKKNKQFSAADITKSVGWIETSDGVSGMNCTFLGNSVIFMKHLFTGSICTEAIITKDGTSATVKGTDCVLIADDTFCVKRPSVFMSEVMMKAIKPLSFGYTAAGAEVMLVAFPSLDDVKKNQHCATEKGKVQLVDSTIDRERATYTCDSIPGNCGAPVINVFGQVVGFHDATQGSVNVFIPVTPAMVGKIPSGKNF